VVINQDIVRHLHQINMGSVKDAGTLLAYLSGYLGASGRGMGAVDCKVLASLIDEWLEKERGNAIEI
jgi:hypothetical protein